MLCTQFKLFAVIISIVTLDLLNSSEKEEEKINLKLILLTI